MTAPELQRQITREVYERDAADRHREVARHVLAAGRLAVISDGRTLRAALWPTRRALALNGRLWLVHPVLPISWAERALDQGWILATGHREVRDGAVWAAYTLTPAGRRFAEQPTQAELGRAPPGQRWPEGLPQGRGEIVVTPAGRSALRDADR